MNPNTYVISEHSSAQVLKVQHLLNEFDCKRILFDINERLSKGYVHCIIDLSSIQYINSSIISLFLTTLRRTSQHGGRLILNQPPKQALHLLDVAKLRPHFEISNNIENAFFLLSLNIGSAAASIF